MPRNNFRKQTGINATQEDLQKLAEVQQAPQVIGRRGLPQPSGVGNAFAQEPTAPVVGQPKIQAPIVQQADQGTVLKQAPMSEQFTQMGIQQGGFIPQQLGESVAAPTSPQANFEARMATGLPLTEQEIGQAQQFATSMGTTFDPQTGYSREPFLAQQAQQAAQTQASFQAPDGKMYGISAGESVKDAFDRFRAGEATAMTPDQVQAQQAFIQSQQAAQTSPPITQPTGAPTVDGVPVMEWIKGGRQLDPQGRFIPEGFETREQALEAKGIDIPERTQTTSVGLQSTGAGLDRTTGPLTYGGHTKHELREMVGGGKKLRQAMAFARAGRDPMTGAVMEQPKQKTAQELETERLELQKLRQEVEEGARPEEMTPYQKAQIEMQKAGLGLKMSEAEAKAQGVNRDQLERMSKAAGALKTISDDLQLIREKGEEIKDLTMKPRTEGLLAKAIAKVSPTSTAAQLERASGVLTGDAFIKGMKVIKDFGGGLGSVTEVEGLKVERAQGAIFEPGMSDVERRNAVDNYIKVRETAYSNIRKAFVDEFGEENAQKYLGDASTGIQAGQPAATQATDNMSQYEGSGYKVTITG